MKNKKGKNYGKYLPLGDVPECCNGCKNHESDAPDEYSPDYDYCTLGLFFPTSKQTCKLRQ